MLTKAQKAISDIAETLLGLDLVNKTPSGERNTIDSESTGQSLHSCAQCGGPAKKKCVACDDSCDDGGNRLSSTWYCSVHCQSKHWSTHKKPCQSLRFRKILFRAANTAQDLFYIYRRIIYDYNIIKMKRIGDKILLYHGKYVTNPANDSFLFFQFPADLLENENDRKAVLCHLAAGDAMGYMGVVIKKMLAGISREIIEITIDVSHPRPLEIRPFWSDGAEDLRIFLHKALQITLKDGGVYIMDLTGAQYGFQESMLPYSEYLRLRGGHIIRQCPFGSPTSFVEMSNYVGGPQVQAVRLFQEEMNKAFNTIIAKWEDDQMSLVKMLGLQEEAYLDTRGPLLRWIERMFGEYKKWVLKEWRLSRT